MNCAKLNKGALSFILRADPNVQKLSEFATMHISTEKKELKDWNKLFLDQDFLGLQGDKYLLTVDYGVIDLYHFHNGINMVLSNPGMATRAYISGGKYKTEEGEIKTYPGQYEKDWGASIDDHPSDYLGAKLGDIIKGAATSKAIEGVQLYTVHNDALNNNTPVSMTVNRMITTKEYIDIIQNALSRFHPLTAVQEDKLYRYLGIKRKRVGIYPERSGQFTHNAIKPPVGTKHPTHKIYTKDFDRGYKSVRPFNFRFLLKEAGILP